MKSLKYILLYTLSFVFITTSCSDESVYKRYEDWRKENEAFMKQIEERYQREGANGKIKKISSEYFSGVGIYYEVIESGEKESGSPKYNDYIKVFYKGYNIYGVKSDGNFSGDKPIVGDADANVGDDEPSIFLLNTLIYGWKESLSKMNKGDRWKIYIPWNLGYGDAETSETIKPYSTLIFDVTLLDFDSDRLELKNRR